MFRRLVPLVAVVGLALGFQPVPAQTQPAGAPSLILRVRSIDSLIADAKYLLALSGQQDVAEQADGVIKSMIGPKGLEGIDTKRPIGFYGSIDPNTMEASGVGLVPIADEKAFLDILDRLNLNLKRGKDGIHVFSPPSSPVDAYFRFANKYAYISANLDPDKAKAALAPARLRDPAVVLPASETAALSAVIRLGDIPKPISQLFLQQLDSEFAKAKLEKGESEVQQKLKGAILDEVSRRFKAVFNEGDELAVRFDIDRKAGELVAEASLSGRAKTRLAADIAGYGQLKSAVSSVVGTDSALSTLIHIVLPEEVRKAFEPMIDEATADALKNEKDPVKRAQAEKFLTAIGPTLKSGEVDFAISMRGPGANQKYAAVMGIKVKDGADIDQTIRTLVSQMKKEEQERITFDAEKVGAVGITKIDIRREQDETTKQIFGQEMLYIAFRPDAVLAAFGEGGLEALKEALTAKPKEAPPFQFELALSRFVPAIAATDPAAAKAAENVFPNLAKGSDVIRASVEGGKALRARFVMKAETVKFFGEVAKLKKEGQ